MAIFNRKPIEPAPIETGIDILRRALKVRSKVPNAINALLDGGVQSTDTHVG